MYLDSCFYKFRFVYGSLKCVAQNAPKQNDVALCHWLVRCHVTRKQSIIFNKHLNFQKYVLITVIRLNKLYNFWAISG